MGRKKTDEQLDYDNLVLNTRELLKLKAGKDFIWHILALCGIYQDTYTGDNHTFYLDGRRSVGLDMLQVLEDADVTAYARLMLEKNKSQQAKGQQEDSGEYDDGTDDTNDT